MDTALYIFAGILGLLIVAVLVMFIVSAVQQWRTPMDERMEQVRQQLRKSESPTGATSILSGYRMGVSDEAVKEIADADGYQWSGYSGQNDRRLNFQRKLPGRE